MPLTRGRTSAVQFHKFCLALKSKSSGAPITAKDSPFCPSAGSSSAPSPGLIAAEGSQGLGEPQSQRPRLPAPRLNPPHAPKALQSSLNFADRLLDHNAGLRPAGGVGGNDPSRR